MRCFLTLCLIGCGAVSPLPEAPAVAEVEAVAPRDLPVEVRVGERVSCVRTGAGDVWCWGDGARPARVGEGADELRGSDMCERPGGCPEGATAYSGHGRFRCALVAGGRVVCSERTDFPYRPVARLEGATRISAGQDFGCALVDSDVHCWGTNHYGQLGRVEDDDWRAGPVEGLPARVLEIAAGETTACALLETGQVWCWGSGFDGGVANPEHFVGALPPTVVSGLEGVRHLTDRCALLAGGEVRCWGGWRVAQMLPCDHPARRESRVGPVPVVGLPPMGTIDSSGAHACGIAIDGEVWCWGDNESNQLGDGASGDHPAPRHVDLREVSGRRECATNEMIASGRLANVGVDPSRHAVELCLEATERACFRLDLDEGEAAPIGSPSAPPPPAPARPSWVVRRLGAFLSICPARGTACRELAAPEGFLEALERSGRVADDGAIEVPLAAVTEDGSTLGLAWTLEELDARGAYQHRVEIYDLEEGRRVHEAAGTGAEADLGLRAMGDSLLFALSNRVIIAYAPRFRRLQSSPLRGPVDLDRVYPLRSGRWLYVPPESSELLVLGSDGRVVARHRIARPRAVPMPTPVVLPLSGGYALAYPGARGGGGDVVLLDAEDGRPIRTVSPPRCEDVLPDVPEC